MHEVHDLPQLYARPSAAAILDVLRNLEQQPPSLSIGEEKNVSSSEINPSGIPRYLTSIISSTLHWIQNEGSREQIWAAASARLSERSGRTAMPSMIRTFEIPVSEDETVRIRLYEPSLTSDNLGLKTWTSSVLLARRLIDLQQHLPQPCSRVLELGAGTGLVGIAAACAWAANVTLTDLSEILPNLQKNIDGNREMIEGRGGTARAQLLDWSDMENGALKVNDRFLIILAADPLYSPDHPRMLADTVHQYLQRTSQARFVIMFPLRKEYHHEREDLKTLLNDIGLQITEEGPQSGQEDWEDNLGKQIEVECWWAIWQYKDLASDVATCLGCPN